MEQAGTTSVLLIASDEVTTGIRRLVEAAGPPPAFALEATASLGAGLQRLDEALFDVILLDHTAASSLDDLEVLGLFGRPEPLVLLAATPDAEAARQALALGAQDFLAVSELTPAWLRRALRYAVERRQVHAALETSETRFRTMIEQNADGVLIVDDDGTIRFVNEAAERLLGHDRATLVGALWGFPVVEDDPAELDIPRANGERCVVEMRMVELEWERRPSFLASLRDVTKRVEAEEAARESEARLKAILDSSSDHIAALDTDLRFLFFNDAYQRLIAHFFGPTLTPGMALTEALANRPADAEAAAALWQRALAGDAYETEYEIGDVLHGDGHAFSLTFNPVRDEQGRVEAAVLVLHDITERKRTLRRLERTTVQLRRSNEELKRFADVAGHDLREPLRSTSLYLQLLRERHPDRLGEKADRLISAALRGLDRMRQLIDDLLDYARVDARGLSPEPVDTAALLEQVRADMQAAIEESGAEIHYAGLPCVRADGRQLKQVFQNLISNAIKFRNDVAPRIEVAARQENDHWVFAVSDNGIGLEPGYERRIFGMFERLHHRDEYAGTGMGLSICEKIVQRHGGEIWVESTPGEGATFYFTLPVELPLVVD